MGIIKRQSIKNSIVSYVGVGIGALSMLFVYTLDKEIYGYAQFLYSTALFIVPFASLGILSLVLKFYPTFKDEEAKDNGFLVLILFLFTLFFAIFLLLIYLFGEYFLSFVHHLRLDEENRLKENLIYILPLSYCVGLVSIFTNQAANFQRIVVPEILQNLGYKVFLPGLILLFVFGYLSKENVAMLVVAFFVIAAVSLFLYLLFLGATNMRMPNWEVLNSETIKEIRSYGLFTAFNGMGSVLAFRLDVIMVSTLIDLENTGLYSIMLFMAAVIEVPSRAINKIATPIISKAWQKDDRDEIQMIYTKSSVNLSIIGSAIFLMIWFSLPALDSISPGEESFYVGRYIFLFLGMAKLVDMITSVNTPILALSEKFKYALLFLIILSVLNVFLNYYLINGQGVVGAAMATFIAVCVYNLLKFGFIWRSFRMQPFNWNLIKVILVSVGVGILLHFIPSFTNPFLDIVKNGLVFLVVFFPLIYILKVSPDLNDMLIKFVSKVER